RRSSDLGDVYAVLQHRAFLRGVKHGTARAQLGGADQGREELGAVFQVQGNNITLANALSAEVMGEAVGPFIELPIGDFDILIEDGRAVPILFHVALDHFANGERLGGAFDGVVVIASGNGR